MITMHVEQAYAGAVRGAGRTWMARTVLDGVEHRYGPSGNACSGLARVLVAEGCPDQAWQTVNQYGQRSLFGKSLHRLATLTTSEATGRIRFVPWAPNPRWERTP